MKEDKIMKQECENAILQYAPIIRQINAAIDGEHKEYLWNFFHDSFYSQSQVDYREAIPEFIEELFDLNKPFAKSDLDILTELYKTLQNKVIHVG